MGFANPATEIFEPAFSGSLLLDSQIPPVPFFQLVLYSPSSLHSLSFPLLLPSPSPSLPLLLYTSPLTPPYPTPTAPLLTTTYNGSQGSL